MSMKKLTTYLCSIISIFSLIYFTVKYYFNGELFFGEKSVLLWTILIFIILSTLILGIVNNQELQTIKRNNVDLINLVLKLVDSHEDKCEELLTTLLNSRDIELDIYNKIKNGETNDDKLV